MNETFHFQVGEAENRKRLDALLFEQIGAVSRMHLRGLLLENKCFVNGNPEKAGYHLQTGDSVEIEVDLSAVTSMKPEPMPIEIVFEDEEIIVVNKPTEMLVHPTRGVKSGTLLNALAFHLNQEDFSQRRKSAKEERENQPQIHADKRRLESEDQRDELRIANYELQENNPKSKIVRPGLIHRLDKKTSGLMVIAKTPRAHKILSDHFQRKLVEKKYVAVVEGIVEKDFGEIQAPIGHDETLKQWRVAENGKPSETHFQVLERRADTTLIELKPVTGRTNQLRIHCAFLGHPIVGDLNRGGREFSRLCLHAFHLCFWHPNGAERLKFETRLPQEFI